MKQTITILSLVVLGGVVAANAQYPVYRPMPTYSAPAPVYTAPAPVYNPTPAPVYRPAPERTYNAAPVRQYNPEYSAPVVHHRTSSGESSSSGESAPVRVHHSSASSDSGSESAPVHKHHTTASSDSGSESASAHPHSTTSGTTHRHPIESTGSSSTASETAGKPTRSHGPEVAPHGPITSISSTHGSEPNSHPGSTAANPKHPVSSIAPAPATATTGKGPASPAGQTHGIISGITHGPGSSVAHGPHTSAYPHSSGGGSTDGSPSSVVGTSAGSSNSSSGSSTSSFTGGGDSSSGGGNRGGGSGIVSSYGPPPTVEIDSASPGYLVANGDPRVVDFYQGSDAQGELTPQVEDQWDNTLQTEFVDYTVVTAPDQGAPAPVPPAPKHSARRVLAPVEKDLTKDDKLEYDTLLTLALRLNTITDATQAEAAENNFLDRSGRYLANHPDETAIWVLRARLAVHINQEDLGREAAENLKRLVDGGVDDTAWHGLMVELSVRDWMPKKEATPAAT